MLRAAVLVLSFLVVGLAPVVAGAQTETVLYYHTDAIGSVRMITNEAGQVVGRYDYWPFGGPAPTDPPAPPEVRQFGGKERDTTTGYDYFGGRYYQSLTGRFTSVDPVLDVQQAMVDPQRWNRYAYVTNRPLTMVDPDGRVLWDLVDYATLALDIAALQQDPSSVWNWLMVGGDVVGAALPVIPAPGTLTRAVRAAGELVDGPVGFAAIKGAAQAGAREASTIFGRSVQDLKKTLSSGRGEWKRLSAHAEQARAKIYRGGTSIEEVFVNPLTGERVIRHTIVRGDELLHETFRPYAKFGVD